MATARDLAGSADHTDGGLRRVTFELPCTTRGALVTMVASAVVLAAISSTLGVLRHAFDVQVSEVLYSRFTSDRELSFQTWYSSLLLFVAALAVATIALRSGVSRWRWHWWGLGALFVALSADEAVSIHEPLSDRVEATLGAEHLAASWIVPGAAFVAIVAIVYWRFVWSLPRDVLWTVLAAGAIFVVAALGLDEIANQVSDDAGGSTLVSSALANIEELLEMTMVAVFIYVLLRYRERLEVAPVEAGSDRRGSGRRWAGEHPVGGGEANSAHAA